MSAGSFYARYSSADLLSAATAHLRVSDKSGSAELYQIDMLSIEPLCEPSAPLREAYIPVVVGLQSLWVCNPHPTSEISVDYKPTGTTWRDYME